MSQQLS